jgi:phosphoglycolate phosphatase
MIDLVVFDLDGTLVDSHADLAHAANAMLRELGGAPVSDEAVVRMVGEGAAMLVRRALAASGLDPENPGALERFLSIYDECLLDRTKPYDGMQDVLEQLARTRRLAVLTNKPAHATNRVLDGLDLTRFFDPIVGGDTPFGRKPDPAGLLRIISVALSSPERTLMVGDSPIDRQTARNAGTMICLARFGFGYTFTGKDLDGSEIIIDAPGELLERIEQE